MNLNNMNRNTYWIDLFCGFGGVSTGIHLAGQKVIACVNHDPIAIHCHKLNHPEAKHFPEDITDWRVLQKLKLIVDKLRSKEPDCIINIWSSADCFVRGTLILTDKGLVDIKNIKIGDKVWTHKNRFKKVTSKMVKISPTVIIKGKGHFGLETTEEHPFYIRKTTSKWDNDSRKYKENISNANWVSPNDMGFKEFKYKNSPNTRYQWATPILKTNTSIPKLQKRQMPLNNSNFWWLIGRWLADGSVSKKKGKYEVFEICCGKHEINELREKLSYWNVKEENTRAGDNELRWNERDLNTSHLFYTNHKSLVEWLIDNFGMKANGKTLPFWVYSLSLEHKNSLLNGYLSGDGWKGNRIEADSVSKKLAISMRLLLISVGYTPSLSLTPKEKINNVIQGREVNVKDRYKLYYNENTLHSDEDHHWTYIKETLKTNETKLVYNISVEDDESYIADGLVVHNCTHFSKAKGGLSRDADSRTLSEHLLIYDEVLNPDGFYIENVEEFLTWGPLDDKGKVIKKLKGTLYNKWKDEFISRGFNYDYKLLNSADYGAHTSRVRYFGVFKKNGKVEFPEPTHIKPGKPNPKNLPLWKPVKDVLDLSEEGVSIFGLNAKNRPWATKTMARVFKGMKKAVLGDKYLISYYGNGNSHSLDLPCNTLTTKERYASVTVKRKWLVDTQFDNTGKPLSESCQTLIARMDKKPVYLISANNEDEVDHSIEKQGVRPIERLMRWFMRKHGIQDVKIRMLFLDELMRIQGFPEDYILYGKKEDKLKFIGNSVVPIMAKKLVEINKAE